MSLKTFVALAAAGALLSAAGAQARQADPVLVPYNPAFAVDPAALRNSCADEPVRLKFGETLIAAPRGALVSFTPLRVGVVRENDQPVNLSFDADAGCAANPIAVAHATFRVEGRTETVMLAVSQTRDGMSSAARSVIYLRDNGRCPHEGKFTVCKGSQDVNGQKIETYAFIGDQNTGASPSGEPWFALCEGSRSQAACEVSDELPGGVNFRIKLPKGQPNIEDIKAAHAAVRALMDTLKPA